jgi:chromosomal replication initiation ATPase DnaA
MGEAAAPRQLALALGHAESFAREDFLTGPSNATALALVDRWPDWSANAVALVGPAGAGKSHLASIWAAESGARFISARALNEGSVPQALATGALVVEDLVEQAFDERALFHLFNLAREQHDYVLLTAQSAPSAWRVGLRDLASRLRAMPVVTIGPPDDALLRALYVKLFADRQLAIDEGLVAYLAGHTGRSFAAARANVAALDREALRRKRAVTRALAVELFQDGAT